MRGLKAATAIVAMLGLAAGLAAAQPRGESQTPSPTQAARIRAAPDGAGPSHLFWLSGPAPGRAGEDVVGVVDPLFAAVRLYGVTRPGKRAPAPLASRLRTLGACALPIDFRVWQVDQHRRDAVLEAMPKPGPGGHAATAAALTTTTLTLRRDLARRANAAALRQAGQAIDRPGWDPARAIACGKLGRGPVRLGQAAAYRARRGGPNPARTITLTNSARALAPRAALTVHATGPGRLISARELEPAGRARVVQISEAGASDDGMLRVRQRLVVFGARGRRILDFDDTQVRVKVGQRPLAMMPSGELLAMGLRDEGGFSLFSCGRPEAPEGACSVAANEPPPPRAATGLAAVMATPPGPKNAAALFSRVAPVANLSWSVDTTGLPADCRDADGCEVRGQAGRYTPIAGVRLTRGVYRRTGMAYAQTGRGLPDAERFTATGSEGFSRALSHAHEGQGGLPGNLADAFTGDLGIDCSALIQLAWAGPQAQGRLTTLRLQGGPIAYGCPSRLPGAGYLRAGDAIALNLAGALEHAVLFAEPVSIDGASEAWLVLEAASGCGGVCWSLYDPSFFNGWGLYRAAGRSDRPCPMAPAQASLTTAPIPRERSGWLRMLRGG